MELLNEPSNVCVPPNTTVISNSNKSDQIQDMTPEEYNTTIREITDIAKSIAIIKDNSDGRIDSAVKERPFLEELKRLLNEKYPNWEIIICPPRASCDMMVNLIRINLKLTNCKTADNSVNKPSIFFSITGLSTYPYTSNWNEFYDRLIEAKNNNQIKIRRCKATEYHYLVKNKDTGDVLLKPIFDIHTYVSNPSNDLQINWKKEFEKLDYYTEDSRYVKKVEELLICIQRSVKDMIRRTEKFANADLNALFHD